MIQTVKVEFLTFFSNMKQYIQYSHIMAEVHSSMFFDPEAHPEDTLKAFLEFTQRFILQYKVSRSSESLFGADNREVEDPPYYY